MAIDCVHYLELCVLEFCYLLFPNVHVNECSDNRETTAHYTVRQGGI